MSICVTDNHFIIMSEGDIMQKLGSLSSILVVGIGVLIWGMTCGPVAAQQEAAQIILDASMISVEPGVGFDDEAE